MRDYVPQAEIDWLYGLQHFGIKLGLHNIRDLLDELGRPETAFRSVLVAGTNGKGSVAAMLQAMLEASGVKTGLFTSPHLVRPNERIRIGDRDIDGEELGRQLREMRERIEAGVKRGDIDAQLSFFEVITATALKSFREHACRVAVLEVGLGGRLDATNAVEADLSVIVSIDLDHTKTLGPTLEQIAGEKGGIIKTGREVVSGVVRQRALSVLQTLCRERDAKLIDALSEVRLTAESRDEITLESRSRRYGGLKIALAGRHQIHNARVALSAFERLAERAGFDVDPEAVREGLASVRWPARLQWIPGEPDLLLDGAHNPAGAATLANYLEGVSRPAPVALVGVMHGKLLDGMIRPLAPHLDSVVVTRASVRRAADPDEVASVIGNHVDRVEVVPDPLEAFDRVRELAGRDRYVLVTGSLYLIGEVLATLEPSPSPGPVSM